jgi:hypothetical protein
VERPTLKIGAVGCRASVKISEGSGSVQIVSNMVEVGSGQNIGMSRVVWKRGIGSAVHYANDMYRVRVGSPIYTERRCV